MYYRMRTYIIVANIREVHPESKVGVTSQPSRSTDARRTSPGLQGTPRDSTGVAKGTVFDRSTGSCGLYVALPLWIHSQISGFEPRRQVEQSEK